MEDGVEICRGCGAGVRACTFRRMWKFLFQLLDVRLVSKSVGREKVRGLFYCREIRAPLNLPIPLSFAPCRIIDGGQHATISIVEMPGAWTPRSVSKVVYSYRAASTVAESFGEE